MSILVYWLEDSGPEAEEFGPTELGPALKRAEELRRAGWRHVCISTELPDSVGKPGVNDVLPPGYDWKKRRT